MTILNVCTADYLNSTCGRFICLEFDLIDDNDERFTDWFMYDTINDELTNYELCEDKEINENDVIYMAVFCKEKTRYVRLCDMTNTAHGKLIQDKMNYDPEFNKMIKTLVIDSMI